MSTLLTNYAWKTFLNGVDPNSQLKTFTNDADLNFALKALNLKSALKTFKKGVDPVHCKNETKFKACTKNYKNC